LSDQTPFPPGARIVVRETEWLVRSCTATERDGYKIRATGISELIRDEDAVFFTELEDPKPGATPHNGNAESFAELVNMLDPAAIADKRHYEPKDVEHLYIRRTKVSPEVTNEIGAKGKTRRGRFISYAQLGINQLGAAYEG
jgi:hypothetical protein